MNSSTRSKVMWTLWMTGAGLTAAVVVLLATGSIWWAVLALIASGPVLNLIAQLLVQPAGAIRGSQRPANRDTHRAGHR